MKNHILRTWAVVVAVATFVGGAQAIQVVDVTVAEGSINNALFTINNYGAAGFGTLQTFLTLKRDGSVERGYNTGQTPAMPDVVTQGGKTTDVLLGNIPTVTVGGTKYYEFLFNGNEDSDKWLSLDFLAIYTSPMLISPVNVESSLSQAVQRYQFTSSDGVVLWKGSNGQGAVDMLALVPWDNFAGASASDYLYLYAGMGAYGTVGGNDYSASDGDESVSVRGNAQTQPPPAVPDAGSTLGLLVMAVLCVGGLRRCVAR